MGKNIFIVNSPGSNVGDEAALKGIIYGIKRIDKDININVSYNGVTSFDSITNYVNKIYDESKFLKKERYIIIITKAILKKFGFIKNNKDIESDFLQSFKESDLILVAPGGCGISNMSIRLWISLLRIILLSKIFKNKVFLNAPSMGPFNNNAITKMVYKFIINNVEAVTLRDRTSLKNVSLLNLEFNKEIVITSDSAMQIPIYFKKQQHYLDKEKIKIAITPIELAWCNFYKNDKNMDTNIKNIFIDIIKYIRHNYKNSEITLIPHLYGTQNDVQLCNDIKNKCDCKNVKVSNTLDAENALLEYQNYDICIGARHHSTAFASKMAIPSICLAYEHKALGFMEQCNMQDYVIDIRDVSLEKLIDKFEYIIKNYDSLVKNLKDSIKKVENDALNNSKIAVTLVQKNCTVKE